MGHTKEQREFVMRELQSLGWSRLGETIYSPSGGLWFSESHFENWSPQEMQEIINNRGKRIEGAKNENWERSSKEHYQLSESIIKMTV